MAKLDEYFRIARREKATDIYFNVGSPPHLKKNGNLIPLADVDRLSKGKIEEFLGRLLSAEKLSKFKKTGELITHHVVNGIGRFRLAASNGRYGPLVVCRLLPLTIPDFEELGLPLRLKDLVSNKSGLILVIGRAGSGKTTTLASLIETIGQTSEKSIVTVETAMEYQYPKNGSLMERIQADTDGELFRESAFGGFLKTVDVLAIDGLPLEKAIPPALIAATEGLLVLLTVASNGGVAEIISRIIYSCSPKKRGYRRLILARVLRGALWQHLFPLKDSPGFVPAAEFLLNDPVLARLIGREGQMHLLRPAMAAAQKTGMQTMHQALDNLKKESRIDEGIVSAFEKELLEYYISPFKTGC